MIVQHVHIVVDPNTTDAQAAVAGVSLTHKGAAKIADKLEADGLFAEESLLVQEWIIDDDSGEQWG